MEFYFGFLKRKKRQSAEDEYSEYRLRLGYLQDRLEKVRQLFDLETDPENIDALIYEEKAIMISLDNLLKTVKTKHNESFADKFVT